MSLAFCDRLWHAFAVVISSLLVVASPSSAQPSAQRTAAAAAQTFTMEQVRSYPFPNELTAAASGSRIAWAFDERGIRNIYVAEGPAFEPRRLTNHATDDGQELTSVSLTREGSWVVFVRGGEHGSNWDRQVPVNASSLPGGQKMQLIALPFAGGGSVVLGEGDDPAVSPEGDVVAFVRDRQLWLAAIDGSSPARRIVSTRGDVSDPQWSPDGSRLAFVTNRGTHSLIGIYASDSASISWMAPSTSRDNSPRWSPDGTRIAFIRRPGTGGSPQPVLEQRHVPWAIWIADVSTGRGRLLRQAPITLRGSLPTTHGGANLHWAAGGRIVFLAYDDGWPHLYSIAEGGGEAMLLTPGNWMAEHVRLSPDRRTLIFTANAGSDPLDIDRRHIVRVPVDRAEPRVLTPGSGLEWSPVFTGDGASIALIIATPQRPPLPAVMPATGGAPRLLAQALLPREFPMAQLVTPRQVILEAPDGVRVHAQIFERPGGQARKPAVIYVHGGPPRQMLLGWHYSDYYSNAYALNQHLANLGFIVMSVNFRLGIGYGHDFHRPAGGGAQGASEYQDVKAAGEWLRRQSSVDPSRIAIYGGSYGGYLTALALARDSELFAAGVDIHGVHDFTSNGGQRQGMGQWRYEDDGRAQAADAAWRSSPVSAVATWKSPVLLIHGDDDRNVRFSETVDLVQRLREAGVPFEELVIPDDTHHFMTHRNRMIVNEATADFLERTVGARRTVGSRR